MSAPVPYVIIMSDGVTVRTVHPAGLGRHREAVDAIVADLTGATVLSTKPTSTTSPSTSAMLTQGEVARTSGFSGNSCQSCGSFSMVRTGTCETCASCGSTSGGCS